MPKISQIDEVPCQAEVRILQKITLNEPLLPSESYQGERGWEVLRRLSYLTAGKK